MASSSERPKQVSFNTSPATPFRLVQTLSNPSGIIIPPNYFSGIIENLTFKYPNGN
jgi:hypothetical protein